MSMEGVFLFESLRVTPLVHEVAGIINNTVEDLGGVGVYMVASPLHQVYVDVAVGACPVCLLASGCIEPRSRPMEHRHGNGVGKVVHSLQHRQLGPHYGKGHAGKCSLPTETK